MPVVEISHLPPPAQASESGVTSSGVVQRPRASHLTQYIRQLALSPFPEQCQVPCRTTRPTEGSQVPTLAQNSEKYKDEIQIIWACLKIEVLWKEKMKMIKSYLHQLKLRHCVVCELDTQTFQSMLIGVFILRIVGLEPLFFLYRYLVEHGKMEKQKHLAKQSYVE